MMTNEEMNFEYVGSKRAAEILGISPRRLAQLKKERKIAYSQIGEGAKVYFKISDIHAYLEHFRREARFEDFKKRRK